METKRQETTKAKDMPLIEQKGYERMENEITPIQRVDTYAEPTKKAVSDAVKELNPDINSMNSRG
ncbi:hypothetical protein [uncultured Bacteroides sp.]|uniref:hypothetical protein n=1 Tax=uncultured Bacteroides sp. TaxID=162156 RepID=UPI00261A0451|nr:hypothetical protein [uncultured Bacteroides sp.]